MLATAQTRGNVQVYKGTCYHHYVHIYVVCEFIICDVRSENVSQRSVSTLWEMQNKQFVKILTLFFLFFNSIKYRSMNILCDFEC